MPYQPGFRVKYPWKLSIGFACWLEKMSGLIMSLMFIYLTESASLKGPISALAIIIINYLLLILSLPRFMSDLMFGLAPRLL